MAETPAAPDPEDKPAEEAPVWTPPPGGGTTEATNYPVGELDPEELAFNQSHTPPPKEDD